MMNSQPIKVLVVEDTKEHAQLLEHILSASTYPRFTPVLAYTMAEGVQKLKAGGIELVLLDLTLPDSLPSQTFHTVKELAPELAIVVVSGVADVSKAIELVQAGAQDYLIKGQVDSNLLLRSLQYSYERKRAEVALRHAHDQLEARVHERTIALVETNSRLQQEITERKKAEESALASNRKLTEAMEQLRAAQQALVNRERLNALGQMANGIAHEFNSVLTPILDWTEHLLHKSEEVGSTQSTRDTLEKIQSAANVGAAAVGRVREFARTEANAYAAVNLAELVSQAVAFTETKWRDEAQAAGVMIDVREQHTQAPAVLGESSQLRELVTLLVLNAVRAIPRRGTITIGTAERDGSVLLTIRDDGLGMSKTTRERCIDPNLGSSHADGRSSGYGSIRGIIQRHNAKLEVESEEGRGAKISVVFPSVTTAQPPPLLAPTPAAPIPVISAPILATPPPAAPQSRKTKRILVAEDDNMVREVMFVYLSEEGFEVAMAANGRLAVEEFTNANGEFDIVITDRAMPELNGDQLALEIKRQNPAMPVILLTGFGELMLTDGEQPPGVDLVVGKPFTMASLKEALGKVGF